MSYYVYVYLDPRKPGNHQYENYEFDYEPFYVGKGSNNRAWDHLKGNKYNPYLCNKIRNIQKINCSPIVMIYEKMSSENEAFDIEMDMIKSIGRTNLKTGSLCNLTDGGDGIRGYIPSEEHKRKNSESHKGIKFSEEHIINMMKPKCSQSENHRRKIGESRSKRWNITNPDGINFIILNLRSFCRNNNLDHRKMSLVSLGSRNHHKGWKCTKIN
jgi:hypothetical protein